MPRGDLNFKLAIESGVRSLGAGQLRKAEEQFRFAIKRCPDCGAGYRGLAKVFIELDDRGTAHDVLHGGAQKLLRAGNRTEAIELLRDAARLAPSDLAAHRRLAASLANVGDEAAAASEHERFIALAFAQGDASRARLELAYAKEMLPDPSVLRALEERLAREGFIELAPEAAAEAAPVAAPAPPLPADPRERAQVLEARAQDLLTRLDPSASGAAVEAARALLEVGLQQAASDLLLQAISLGTPDRGVQRLLADVVSATGREEIARQKRLLLAEALRLDGDTGAAAELERLASRGPA